MANRRELTQKIMRQEWRKLLEDSYEKDIVALKLRKGLEKQISSTGGVQMKDLGLDYSLHKSRQQNANEIIGERAGKFE